MKKEYPYNCVLYLIISVQRLRKQCGRVCLRSLAYLYFVRYIFNLKGQLCCAMSAMMIFSKVIISTAQNAMLFNILLVRKMSNIAKQNWCCSKCKLEEPSINPQAPKNKSTAEHSGTQNVQNETINNLVDSVNFMSEKFDNFSKQLQELITTINLIKEEN